MTGLTFGKDLPRNFSREEDSDGTIHYKYHPPPHPIRRRSESSSSSGEELLSTKNLERNFKTRRVKQGNQRFLIVDPHTTSSDSSTETSSDDEEEQNFRSNAVGCSSRSLARKRKLMRMTSSSAQAPSIGQDNTTRMSTHTSSSWKNSSGKKKWYPQVIFVAKAHKSGIGYHLTDDDLRQNMEKLTETSEKILNLWVYTSPLADVGQEVEIFFHAFVQFYTNKYSYSIEKQQDGIYIQRSGREQLEHVKDRFLTKKRNTPIKERTGDVGRMTVKDLVKWLYWNDELKKTYSLKNCNCQHFAKRVFDEFAKTRTVTLTTINY
jgi:hypothetical protein